MTKCIIFLLTFTLYANAEAVLDGAALEKAFKGATVDGEYADGLSFSETYFLDGKIIYRDQKRGPLDGVWSVVHDTFCTFYWAMEGACFIIQAKGTNCYEYFVSENSSGSTNDQNIKRWIGRGWRKDEPKTCGDLLV